MWLCIGSRRLVAARESTNIIQALSTRHYNCRLRAPNTNIILTPQHLTMTRIEVREEAACWAHYWLTELYWLYEEITELKEGRVGTASAVF